MRPPQASSGLHHISAICGNPQRNLDFYTKLLGMRLVIKTVNFDDPGTYHLYYGDALGRPGTALTFFPHEGAPPGVRGSGQAVVTALAVPPGSLDWWQARLAAAAVPSQRYSRFDGSEELLAFDDPDGLALELVESAGWMDSAAWEDDCSAAGWDCPVPADYAVRGLHSATLLEADFAASAQFMTDIMGWVEQQRDGERVRFGMGKGGSSAIVDLLDMPAAGPARTALGSVHHLAWRTPDDESQQQWLDWLSSQGSGSSGVRDRKYFHSIYFREPGGSAASRLRQAAASSCAI
jgi:glyoxalase family protein